MMEAARIRADTHRGILDCLASQDIPALPKCSGCKHEHLCRRITGVLQSDARAGETVLQHRLKERR